MTDKKYLGARGETAAQRYLESRGYKIIERNYRVSHLEIDLIAQQKDKLVFIEIKTRIKTDASEIENPLDWWQTKNLKRAILAYCFRNHINLDSVRLDLIIILTDRTMRAATLRHYPDIL